MKIWFKRILISLVVVFIAALVGIAIFLLTFDPNAYKSKLEQIVYERYHRTLAISGDIELSLFPRIGLAVQGVSLSDRDSSDTFASIDSARFAVAIWPLLSNRLVVDHVAVTGFKAWLVRDENGRFNFRDLVQNRPPLVSAQVQASDGQVVSSASQTGPSASPAPASIPAVFSSSAAEKADFQIDIAGLDLKGGEIHLLDRKTGSIGRIVQLDVNTGRMTFDQAFDVALKGRLLGDWPAADAQLEAQALVRIDPLQRSYSAQRLNMLINGKLGDLKTRSATLRGNIAYNEYSQMLSASTLEFLVQGDIEGDAPVEGFDASLSVPQLRVDRSQAELQVTRLALRAKGARPDSSFEVALDAPSLSVSPETAKGEPVSGTVKITSPDDVLGISLQMSGVGGDAYDLTLKELKLDSAYKQGSRVVGVQMSSPATWSPFGRRGGLSAMKGDIRIEDSALPAGSFQFPFIGSMQADLYKDELSSEINAVLSGSKIDFSLAASHLTDPRIAFDLSADDIDLNTLFPPPAKAPAAPTGEADVDTSQEPAPEKTAPAAQPATVRKFDWSFLNSAHVQGTVEVDALKAGNVQLSNVHAGIGAEDGLLSIRDIEADLYGGSLQGDVSFSSDHAVTAGLALNNVDVGPLTRALTHRQQVLGRGDFSLQVATQGDTMPALVANLGGEAKLDVRDGAWVGLNLNQTIAEVNDVLRNAFSGQLPKVLSRFDVARRTEFESLNADASFTNGQGNLHTLELMSPGLSVHGGQPATIDLVNRQLDMMLKVKVHGSRGGEGAFDLSSLDGVTVPVRVSGPFSSPSYRVQWQDIRHRVVKDAIQEGLLDILSQVSGDGAGPFLFTPPDKPDPAKRDPLKSIGDALKGLLGQ